MIVATIILYLLAGGLITMIYTKAIRMNCLRIFIIVFSVFILYTLSVDYFIVNPNVNYFINNDECFFYESAVGLMNYDIGNIWKISFTEFIYHESPLIIFYFSLLAKLAHSLQIDNIALFIKVNNVFLGSLVPIIMYLLAYEFTKIKMKSYSFVWFALLSPLLINACQLTRDVHVVFIYTLMAFIALSGWRLRLVPLVLLFVAGLYVRFETGLFSVVFLFLAYSKLLFKNNPIYKFFIILIVFTFAIFLFDYFVKSALVTIDSYQQRSMDYATSGSLGIRLLSLPFPLNTLAVSIFGQMQPFPFWVAYQHVNIEASFLAAVQCVTPFYWLPILVFVIFEMIYHWGKINPLLRMLFLIAIFYIVMVSSAQAGARRLLAVYPLLFIVYLIFMRNLRLAKNFKDIRNFVCCVYVLLHFVYLFIK